MLLFRSSLSGGGEANYDNYSVQINGQTSNNFISLVPPLWAFLEEDEDIEEFNKPVTFGSAIGGYFSPTGSEGFFFWASNFNQPVNMPPLMNNFHEMFYECSFNSPINWGEATIGNTYQMFYNCTNFNQPIDWSNTYGNTDMSQMFYQATNFNSPITGLGRGKSVGVGVRNMFETFYGAVNFNQFLNFERITNYYYNEDGKGFSCQNCLAWTNYNQPITINAKVNGINLTHMLWGSNFNQPFNVYGAFYDSRGFYPSINVSFLFNECQLFNQEVNFYNVSSFNMFYMFMNCVNYNSPVNLPVLIGQYTENGYFGDAAHLFQNCTQFNQPVKIKLAANMPEGELDMSKMFYGCSQFNGPISFNYIVNNGNEVTYQNANLKCNIDMAFFFANSNFNSLNFELPDSVSNIEYMFYNCVNFNQQNAAFYVPSQIEDCSSLFENCNHISGIYIYKDSNFNAANLNIHDMVYGLTNELACYIIVEGPDQEFSNRLYAQALPTQPIRGMYDSDWNFQDWGCYNLEHNVYIIKNYQEYKNWAGTNLSFFEYS